MIKNKHDLNYYLTEDKKRFASRPTVLDRILHNEKWYIYHYLRHLRFVEYYMNLRNGGSKYSYQFPFLYHWFKYKRLGFKLKFTIYPNTTGPGLMIYHTGDFVHVGKNVHIGKNCTL